MPMVTRSLPLPVLTRSKCELLCTTADCSVNTRKFLTRENLREAFVNVVCDVGSLVDESGVQLHEACSGANLFPCVACGEDTADTDQRDAAAGQFIELGDHLGRPA